jgi:hypothetical protein
MKYDVLHLPGASPPGCGKSYVETRIGDDHQRGDHINIRCPRCGRFGVVEVRAPLEGLV